MKVKIRNTVISEAEILSQIQKAAFKPLYDRYNDEGNPYLRGTDDILKRLNKENRYFTILYENNIVGGIFYRLIGKRSPTEELKEGEYYLARIYIHPDYQGLGVARTAIQLCEKEFPDAETYYVDFPVDMDKNRRCYESVGFIDTGETVRWGNGPLLATYIKHISNE